MRRARLIPFLFLLTEPAALAAQWQLTGEAGRSRIEQPELPTSGATTAGATLDIAHEHSLIHASALGAQTADGRNTGQLVALGSVLTPSWRSWALQGTGGFAAFGQTSLAATTSRDLLVQARTGGSARGAAFGAGLGTTVHNAVAIPNRHAQADGWVSAWRERFTANASLTRTRSVFGGSSILVDISRRTVNYVDLSGGWTHDAGRWSVSAGAGARGRDGTFTSGDTWQAAELTAWIAPHVALVVDAGKSLEDLVRGVPRTRYASLGIRAVSRPHLAFFQRTRRVAGPRITVTAAGDALRRIDITGLADARVGARVELMADFTDWAPVVLDPSGGAWRLERAIAPGPHRLAIRVDGGAWFVPANLPRVEDELGGSVGLITVP